MVFSVDGNIGPEELHLANMNLRYFLQRLTGALNGLAPNFVCRIYTADDQVIGDIANSKNLAFQSSSDLLKINFGEDSSTTKFLVQQVQRDGITIYPDKDNLVIPAKSFIGLKMLTLSSLTNISPQH